MFRETNQSRPHSKPLRGAWVGSSSWKKMWKQCGKRVGQLRAKTTPAEKLMKDALKQLGIKFIFQKGFICKGEAIRVVDFYLPRPLRIILEIDGQEHNEIEDRAREKQILKAMPKAWFVRIKNEEVFEHQNALPEFLRARLSRVQQLNGTGSSCRLDNNAALYGSSPKSMRCSSQHGQQTDKASALQCGIQGAA